jgi:D-sedoheptulose 7-phosphate isomerase
MTTVRSQPPWENPSTAPEPFSPVDDLRQEAVGQQFLDLEQALTATSGYLTELKSSVDAVCEHSVAAIALEVAKTIGRGRTVFVAGNGGSATTANHFGVDLQAAAQRVGRGSCESLALDAARILAIGNDLAFESVFAMQLRQRATPGDMVLVLSVSGTSPNIVKCVQEAQSLGMLAAAATGREQGVFYTADMAVAVGSGDYGLAEDLHLSINHITVRLLLGGRHRVV